jgi:putative flavoprotein involved in K+ transport
MLDKTDDISVSAENWLVQFEAALADADSGALEDLFHPDSYWRDALALSWTLQTINGRDAILKTLTAQAAKAAPAGFAIDRDRAPPRKVMRAGTDCIETIFKFETRTGRGDGIFRLVPDAADGNRLKAWTLLTALEELKGFEEQTRAATPIRAISAARTGWICARLPMPMPTATRRRWWSAADNPAFRSPRG